MRSVHGIAGQRAPELRVPQWLQNVDGQLRIEDVTAPIVYLFSFQSWCLGCHNHGFPTMGEVRATLAATGLVDQVKFVAVQTVFEGYAENTIDAARDSVLRHNMADIALGHDPGDPPYLMVDYRARGTPWTVLIGPRPERVVLYNDFHAVAENLVDVIKQTLDNR